MREFPPLFVLPPRPTVQTEIESRNVVIEIGLILPGIEGHCSISRRSDIRRLIITPPIVDARAEVKTTANGLARNPIRRVRFFVRAPDARQSPGIRLRAHTTGCPRAPSAPVPNARGLGGPAVQSDRVVSAMWESSTDSDTCRLSRRREVLLDTKNLLFFAPP